jgi:hypothetical protein
MDVAIEIIRRATMASTTSSLQNHVVSRKARIFGEKYSLHLHGRRVRKICSCKKAAKASSNLIDVSLEHITPS